MSSPTPPPSGQQEVAGVRPADLDIEKSLNTMQYGIEEMKRGKLKNKVEKQSLKEQITDEFSNLFKNPEAVSGLIGIVGFLTIAELFGLKEDLELKEQGIQETQEELEQMTSAGLIEEVAEKKEEELKEPGKNEVVRGYQTIAIQLKAAMNKRNTKQLKELGITIPEGVKKLTAISIFRRGIGSYEDFKKTLAKTLQPDIKDPNKVTDNLSAILSRCALGKYQILPKYYFKITGWPHKGEEGLRAMYDFLRSPNKQKELNRKSIISKTETFEGDAYAIAASYYAGPKAGHAMLKYRKALRKSDATEKPEWLERKQKMGGGTFGSISYYASKVVKYYGKDKVQLSSAKDISKFQEAIGRKETGFLARKRAKAALTEAA